MIGGGGGEVVPPLSSLSIIIVKNVEGRDGAAMGNTPVGAYVDTSESHEIIIIP